MVGRGPWVPQCGGERVWGPSECHGAGQGSLSMARSGLGVPQQVGGPSAWRGAGWGSLRRVGRGPWVPQCGRDQAGGPSAWLGEGWGSLSMAWSGLGVPQRGLEWVGGLSVCQGAGWGSLSVVGSGLGVLQWPGALRPQRSFLSSDPQGPGEATGPGAGGAEQVAAAGSPQRRGQSAEGGNRVPERGDRGDQQTLRPARAR